MFVVFKITNQTNTPLTHFMTKFNDNSYCLRPVTQKIPMETVQPGETRVGEVEMDLQGNPTGEEPSTPMKIEVALNTNVDIFVFKIPVSFTVLLRYPSEYTPNKYNELLQRPNSINS